MCVGTKCLRKFIFLKIVLNPYIFQRILVILRVEYRESQLTQESGTAGYTCNGNSLI